MSAASRRTTETPTGEEDATAQKRKVGKVGPYEKLQDAYIMHTRGGFSRDSGNPRFSMLLLGSSLLVSVIRLRARRSQRTLKQG